ncbi:MAG TPA: permease-like cell division protein FtsX [Microthrixaceae bacterium]|nr:ABC transporter permease [Microthrixaceae bacterium]MCB9400561.1 ABC transporter permease [Microthrixaceae bacterium]MCC6184970.1 ABC transporter permease [Microthrixaceae bacterium]MCO5306123.1 ABC transporter permease [Microthrixaceae bacterium]HMU79909.1 permease-like cell division protein FtsX [Microthrixaceae bacterium]
MAVRADYILRETGSNLVRNLTLTFAAVLTVAVSLAMVAASYLIGAGINNSFLGLRSDVDLFVYMNPAATAEQIKAMEKTLDSSPQVGEFDFYDSARSYDEFKRLFRDQPDLVNTIKPEDLPQSFRIKPKSTDAEIVSSLGDELEAKEGVLRVEYAAEYAKRMQTSVRTLNTWVLIVGGVLIAASVLLIFNTIRTAVFARRREIEVMRLVGASNWFIRLPFIVEGLVHGLLGAALAAVGAWGFDQLWKRNFVDQVGFELLNQIRWDSGQLWTSILIIFVVGALTGGIGSGIAVSRFLKV